MSWAQKVLISGLVADDVLETQGQPSHAIYAVAGLKDVVADSLRTFKSPDGVAYKFRGTENLSVTDAWCEDSSGILNLEDCSTVTLSDCAVFQAGLSSSSQRPYGAKNLTKA